MESQENKENLEENSKKRIKITNEEREIFKTLVSTGNNGRWGNVILNQSGNNMEKMEAWQAITNAFNSHTGRALTRVQLRGVFNKEKEKLKKKHDTTVTSRTKIDRAIKKKCEMTGAGKPPVIPQDLDGDQSFCSHELDPTPTLFNKLTKPSSKPPPEEEKMDLDEYPILDLDGNPVTDNMGYPLPALKALFDKASSCSSVSPSLSNSCSGTPLNNSFVPPISSTPKSSLATKSTKKAALSSSSLGALNGTTKSLTAIGQANSSAPTLMKSTPRAKTTSGNQEGATISTSPSNAQKQTGSSSVTAKSSSLNPSKVSDNHENRMKDPKNKSTVNNKTRKRGPFNVNDYYCNVYQIQKKVSKKRMNLISHKILNEKFKAVILKKKIRDLKLDCNVTESESDDSSDSDSEGFTGSEDEDPYLVNM